MAIDWTVVYSGKVDATDATNYPYGKARVVTVSGAGDGTPWDPDLINDWAGMFQKLLVEASITPSGDPDTIVASDYYDALIWLIGDTLPIATDGEVQTGTDTEKIVTPAGLSARTATEDRTGIAELATQAEVTAGTDTERIVTPVTLQGKLDALYGPGAWNTPTFTLNSSYFSITPGFNLPFQFRLLDNGRTLELAGMVQCLSTSSTVGSWPLSLVAGGTMSTSGETIEFSVLRIATSTYSASLAYLYYNGTTDIQLRIPAATSGTYYIFNCRISLDFDAY